MNRELASNRELYDYLVALRDKLADRGAFELSAKIDRASKHIAGMSTEFLGESMLALRAVHEQGHMLEVNERDELIKVIDQVERS